MGFGHTCRCLDCEEVLEGALGHGLDLGGVDLAFFEERVAFGGDEDDGEAGFADGICETDVVSILLFARVDNPRLHLRSCAMQLHSLSISGMSSIDDLSLMLYSTNAPSILGMILLSMVSGHITASSSSSMSTSSLETSSSRSRYSCPSALMLRCVACDGGRPGRSNALCTSVDLPTLSPPSTATLISLIGSESCTIISSAQTPSHVPQSHHKSVPPDS